MTSRRDARRLAVDVLYQVDITGMDPDRVIRDREEADRPLPSFAIELVQGVARHRQEIDGLLERHARDWSVERMTALDRTILRVAGYELLHRHDVPPSVAISEAVGAAAELSADEAKRFVNGILGTIAKELSDGSTTDPPASPDSARS